MFVCHCLIPVEAQLWKYYRFIRSFALDSNEQFRWIKSNFIIKMLVSAKEAGINALCNWEPNIQDKTIEDCIVLHKPQNDATMAESDVEYEYK